MRANDGLVELATCPFAVGYLSVLRPSVPDDFAYVSYSSKPPSIPPTLLRYTEPSGTTTQLDINHLESISAFADTIDVDLIHEFQSRPIDFALLYGAIVNRGRVVSNEMFVDFVCFYLPGLKNSLLPITNGSVLTFSHYRQIVIGESPLVFQTSVDVVTGKYKTSSLTG